MQTAEFWTLIEQARADATADGQPDGDAIGDALTERLAQLPPHQIRAFDRLYLRMAQRAETWDLCAAELVITGYISDDSFRRFQAGLIGLGREDFERVVADADTLADLPLVQGIADGRVDRYILPSEAIQDAAAEAFERRTGDDEAFWEPADSPPDEFEEDAVEDDNWSGRFGSTEDIARIPLRLPRLTALFSAAKDTAANHPEP